MELPTWEVWGFLYHKIAFLPLDVASSLSSGLGYVFYGFRSIWEGIVQLLVVNFVVFRR